MRLFADKNDSFFRQIDKLSIQEELSCLLIYVTWKSEEKSGWETIFFSPGVYHVIAFVLWHVGRDMPALRRFVLLRVEYTEDSQEGICSPHSS